MAFNICKVKNIDSSSHTYSGQEIAAGSTYTIQVGERLKWMIDDDLIADITDDKAQIWDSIAAISSYSDQIDWLKDNAPINALLSAKGDIECRHYTSVSGNSTSSLDYTVANGDTLRINEMGGDSSRSIDIKVEIIWDATGTPEKIFCTHGDVPIQRTLKQFDGNGAKKLRILLTNDSGQTETVGAFWIGELL